MKRYDSYKDSGVKWLGEIPRHWKVLPIKRIAETYSGATPSTSNENNWDGNIPWITPADFKTDTKYVNKGSRSITEQGLRCCSAKLVPTNSVIFSKRAPVGQLSITTQPLCTNQGCISCVTRPIIKPLFLFYLLSVYKDTFEAFSGGTTFKEISLQSFNDFNVSLPPLFEQEAIANYLDAATSKIDEAIAQQQKMIDLLNERKQIIINNAVTKGLDPNVPMKDSGVEWIGEIPEHWGVLPIKHFKSHSKNSFVDGPFGSNLKSEHYIENGDVYVIESGMVTTGIFVRKDFKTISYSHFKTIQRSECKAGDIIIAKIGAKFGMAAELPDLGKTCVVSGNSLKLTLNQQLMLNTIFVHNMFLAKCKGGFIGLYQETAQPALSLGDLNNMCFPVPPIEEQKNIEKYLKEKLGIIDTAIEAANKQISLLQERKQIIINDVVTGKVKVL